MMLSSRSIARQASPRAQQRVAVTLALVMLGPLAAPCAQESTEPSDVAPAPRWRLGGDGQVMVWPDPALGGLDGWAPHCDPSDPSMSLWQSLGILGLAACRMTGDGGGARGPAAS